MGGQRGLPAFSSTPQNSTTTKATFAPPFGQARCPQSAGLEPADPEAVVCAQTQAPTSAVNTYRLSRRVSLLDLTPRSVFSVVE